MSKIRLTLMVSLAALLASGTAVAGEIYKWTDEDGNIHYEDRPTGDTTMVRLDVRSTDTDNTVVQARLDQDREARAAARQVASEAPPEMTKEELRAEQDKRKERCQYYRDRLGAFLSARRVYDENDAGERTYLDDDEILAARAAVEEDIQKYCGS